MINDCHTMINDDNFAGCTSDKAWWVKNNARLCSSLFIEQINMTINENIEDLSRLITKHKLFATLPAFLVNGIPAIAKTYKFATEEEADEFGNNIKVLYHIFKKDNEYVVRGWNSEETI